GETGFSLAVAPEGAVGEWLGAPRGRSSIYLQRLDARGQLRGPPIQISDGPGLVFEPDWVWSADGLVVAWYERERKAGMLTAWLAAVAPDGRSEERRVGEEWRSGRAPGQLTEKHSK